MKDKIELLIWFKIIEPICNVIIQYYRIKHNDSVIRLNADTGKHKLASKFLQKAFNWGTTYK